MPTHPFGLFPKRKDFTITVRVKSRIEESLGRYLIEAEIGRGAMGVVYRARDPKIDRLVAIKTISLAGQEAQDEQDYRERFLQEARAAGRLSHPGIVTIFDAGEDLETREPYLVMEYICGQSLQKILLDSGRKLAVEDALHYVLEIAEALDYAHAQGVVHRDIKPANILITEDNRAKIADFGVARLNHTLVTHTGQIFGSPAYMAPEQLTKGQADARSDLFSVGVMLYSMLTGFRPFQGNSAETVCFKVMNFDPVPVTSFQAGMHPDLDLIVGRAIAKDPDERYQRGAEFARDIRQFLSDSESAIETPGFIPEFTLKLGQHRNAGHASAATLKRFLARAGIAALVSAGLLTGWQVRRELRDTAKIEPPAPLVESAPTVEKTPAVPVKRVKQVKRVKKTVVPPTVENARLHVEIMHHFPEGKASVKVDDRVALEENLHGDDQRHPILRTLEMNQTATFEVAPGKHRVEVHVVTPDSIYDETESLDAELAPGLKYVLRVNCDKRKMQVILRPPQQKESSPSGLLNVNHPREN